jgi:hypothetical protein
MVELKLDAAIVAQLRALNGPAAVVDESGKVIGHFTPAIKPPVYPHPEDGCPYSPEELQRMRNSGKGRPLKEIWRELGAQ